MTVRKLVARRHNVASNKMWLYTLNLVFCQCECLYLPYHSRTSWKPSTDPLLAFQWAGVHITAFTNHFYYDCLLI
jgi:hypothetical protein